MFVDLPSNVEEAYRAEAHSKGVPIDELVREVLIAHQSIAASEGTVFEDGLGLFGSPEDAALLDEVVALAYEERRRPSEPAL